MPRIAVILAALMFAAGVGAIVVQPSLKAADQGPGIKLELMVPAQFGEWQQAQQIGAQVINPQTKELLDKLYSQIVTRSYVGPDGYRIMLSIAYGSDQRGQLQAHKPEVCYPAQGFQLHKAESGEIASPFGRIPVKRLFTSLGARQEPVTYWFTVGDKAVQSPTQKRLVELRYGLTGQIPDGILFRVSSIDPDVARAYRMQEQFVNALLGAVPVDARQRLSGLGDGT